MGTQSAGPRFRGLDAAERHMGNHPGAALIVEDNLLLNRLLGDMVRTLGFAVTAVCSVDQARRAMDEASFDCLVTDLNLDSEPAGLLLAEEALGHGASRVVLTSGHPMPATLADPIVFLAKPFTIDQLERAIDG
jgi:DNA-binding NtrC family response regulator